MERRHCVEMGYGRVYGRVTCGFTGGLRAGRCWVDVGLLLRLNLMDAGLVMDASPVLDASSVMEQLEAGASMCLVPLVLSLSPVP